MKRILAFLFAALMLASCAFAAEPAEITYQGIPWGSSVETVKKWAKDQGFKVVSEYMISPPSYLDAEGKFTQGIMTITSDTSYTLVTAQQNSAFQAAGYDVSSLNFCFDTVDGKPALATVAVKIGNLVSNADQMEQMMDDLEQKLIMVYGENECTTEPKTNSFMPSYVSRGERYFKQGANNTAVCLTNSLGVTIVYGKTDAFADLEQQPSVTVSPFNVIGL